jgi:uncharacterized protein
MIDLTQLTGFQWDAGNATKNELKHGVTQREAEQVFFNLPLYFLDDTRHNQLESRWHAYGMTHEKRCLQIPFTLRQNGEMIRIISARDMHTKERKWYEDQGA